MLAAPPSPNITSLILGSAAIGALVSSIITFAGQVLERRARRQELLLSESVKLAMAHHAAQVEYAKLTRENRFIPEHVRLVQVYFIAMKHLILTGKLPVGMFQTDRPEEIEEFQREWDR